ncbi:MAG TPA: malate dehydrogenase [Nitrospirales bacterium]|nr:malate dehydrogenase [Nitrospirales bacterium]
MAREKITVIGAGNVGGTTAQRLVESGWCDVVLLDIIDGVPQGKALDLTEACPLMGSDGRIEGTGDYKASAGSAVVVITSGVPRKPGMSREQLLETNVRIVRDVVRQTVAVSPGAILLVVTNPLDAMTYVASKVSRFPRERVVGMAGALDAARFRAFIAAELRVSVEDVQAMVLGGHGDSMVPLIRYATVAGVPLRDWLPQERIDALVKRTREGGAEIVSLLKTGSAFYAPSASIVAMVEAILKDSKKILPCAALCRGEYGVDGLFVGVPVKLGRRGVEEIVQLPLSTEEQAALAQSAAAVKELCALVDRYL